MLKSKETEQFILHMLSNTYLMLLTNMYVLTFAQNVEEQLTSSETMLKNTFHYELSFIYEAMYHHEALKGINSIHNVSIPVFFITFL